MKTKNVLFWIGAILVFWSLIIILSAGIARNLEIANALSFGVFYKLMIPKFKELAIIFFFTLCLIGCLLMYFFSNKRK